MIKEWLMLHGEWLIFGFILLCFGVLLLRQHLSNNAPTYTAAATVEKRRMEPGKYHSRWSSGWNHLVTFRLSGEDTVELYTTEQEYHDLKEGLSVTIVWQNENLLRYET